MFLEVRDMSVTSQVRLGPSLERRLGPTEWESPSTSQFVSLFHFTENLFSEKSSLKALQALRRR
jgi:hypothetical protein